MTTIAAKKEKDHIHICADTRTSYGDERSDDSVGGVKLQKLIKVNDEFYIAVCGQASLATYNEIFSRTNLPQDNDVKSIIDYFIKFRHYYREMTEENELVGSGFVVFRDKLFEIIWDSITVFEIQEFVAKGSGRCYAISALHLGKSAKEAVELSCKLDAFSELPIQEYRITLKNQ